MEQEKINRLQWILDDAVARGEIPGAILMVRKEGKETVYLESGYADIEAKKPVSRDSIYRLYSMSKPITATAVMILVERGLIDLADPVCRYLPGFCGQMVAAADGHVEKPWRDVTIQDLVNMTSGLVYDGNHLTGKQTEALFTEVIQGLDEGEGGAYGTVEIANRLGQIPLAFQPARSWCYGTSADVAGALVLVRAKLVGSPSDGVGVLCLVGRHHGVVGVAVVLEDVELKCLRVRNGSRCGQQRKDQGFHPGGFSWGHFKISPRHRYLIST